MNDPLDALSSKELDYLWQLMKEHVPVTSREDLIALLRDMATSSHTTVTVTSGRVDVKIPSVVIGFDR